MKIIKTVYKILKIFITSEINNQYYYQFIFLFERKNSWRNEMIY